MKNGDRVKDVITGYSGIVIAEHTYLNGCKRVTVQPEKLADGKLQDAQTFDVEQLSVVKPKVHSLLAPTGGPEKTPARASIPPRR
jgi:hypothetical protein